MTAQEQIDEVLEREKEMTQKIKDDDYWDLHERQGDTAPKLARMLKETLSIISNELDNEGYTGILERIDQIANGTFGGEETEK